MSLKLARKYFGMCANLKRLEHRWEIYWGVVGFNYYVITSDERCDDSPPVVRFHGTSVAQFVVDLKIN